MAELLRRIITANIGNVFIRDLNIKLRKSGDSIDLLALIKSGVSSIETRRRLEEIAASHDLDFAIAKGWVTVTDQDGIVLSTVEAIKSTNLLTLHENNGSGGSGATSLPDLLDVNDAVLPSLGDILVGDGSEWISISLDGANKILGINSTNTGLEYKTIVEGSNITVTHGVGTVTIASTLPGHDLTHIKDGVDEIDGDQVDIDFTPQNYSPNISPPEVTDYDHLSAHLAGIDSAIGESYGYGYGYADGSLSHISFLDLFDVDEVTYTGKSGQIPVVKNTEDGLEFQAVPGITPTVSGRIHSLLLMGG